MTDRISKPRETDGSTFSSSSLEVRVLRDKSGYCFEVTYPDGTCYIGSYSYASVANCLVGVEVLISEELVQGPQFTHFTW